MLTAVYFVRRKAYGIFIQQTFKLKEPGAGGKAKEKVYEAELFYKGYERNSSV